MESVNWLYIQVVENHLCPMLPLVCFFVTVSQGGGGRPQHPSSDRWTSERGLWKGMRALRHLSLSGGEDQRLWATDQKCTHLVLQKSVVVLVSCRPTGT